MCAAAVVEDFLYLQDKASQLFAGLRELSLTTSRKQWQPQFQQTFDVYKRLWKYQQVHRATLQDPKLYNLTRPEIGDIASKIGQLYYHYYLRTSQVQYLQESFTFYSGVRERKYLEECTASRDSSQVIKPLRYYARFIVVCLLLNKIQLTHELRDELAQILTTTSTILNTSEMNEWQHVQSELTSFLNGLSRFYFVGVDDSAFNTARLPCRHRVAELTHSMSTKPIYIDEAVLVTSSAKEVKLSELTIDLFGILQCMEYQLPSSASKAKQPSRSKRKVPDDNAQEDSDSLRRVHKYLLCYPTIAALQEALAASSLNLADNNATLLLYIAGDSLQHETMCGVQLSPGSGSCAGVSCFYPHDLSPLTRTPLVVIIDAPCSHSFLAVRSIFNKPLLCLASAVSYPGNLQDENVCGRILTTFLRDPLAGLCYLSNHHKLTDAEWTMAHQQINPLELQAQELLLTTVREADPQSPWGLLRGLLTHDEIALQICGRFLICTVLHHLLIVLENNPNFQSCSYPAFTPSILSNPSLVQSLRVLLVACHIDHLYKHTLQP